MSDHFGTLWIKGLKHSQRIHSTKPHPNFKAIISLKISFRQKGLFKKSIRLIYFFGRWIINFLSLYINILQSIKLLQRWFNGFSTWSSCNILTKSLTNSHVVLPMKLYGSKKKKLLKSVRQFHLHAIYEWKHDSWNHWRHIAHFSQSSFGSFSVP